MIFASDDARRRRLQITTSAPKSAGRVTQRRALKRYRRLVVVWGMAIHQPHDHLFRRVFGAPQEAASFLQARLPQSLRRSLRWSSLKRHPASYVTPDLHGAASDLLFEIAHAAPGADHAPIWLYLLFEHQSTPDRWMRLRLLDYCCRIWERDRRDHKNARYLRPILPLVFYQGPTGWRHSPQFVDLFPAAVRDWRWLPRFEHVLFDQTRIRPAQVAGSRRARLLQLTMMHAFNRAVPAVRKRMQPLLGDLEREPEGGGQDDVKTFVQYMLETGPDDTPDVMDEILSHTTAELRGELMRTSGDRLRQEGRDEMRGEMRVIAEQRHRQGRLEGQREGRLETIDGLLRTGVDWSVIERATGIGEAQYRKLTKERRDGGSADRGGLGRD